MSSVSTTAAQERALRLARRLDSLPEPAMREAILAEACLEGDAAEVVEVLATLLQAGHIHVGPPYASALVALPGALADGGHLSYERRAELYAASKARHPEIAQLLFAGGHMPDEPKAPDPEQPVMPGKDGIPGKPLTLGERKALARGDRRELLDRLLRDPDPQVIRVILQNRRLTERDVLVIASRRPTRADVLLEVATSTWKTRYEVKKALVMNPYTPSDMAIRLVPSLHEYDLRAVADDWHLPESIRLVARRLLSPG